MAEHKEGWVTLKSGAKVYLDKDGNITRGPEKLIGENISDLDYKSDATPLPAPKRSFGSYVKQFSGQKNGNLKAAMKYYKDQIQGHYVSTSITNTSGNMIPCDVFFTRVGNGGNDLTVKMGNNSIKPHLVEKIPDIIKSGRYVGRENVSHARCDYSVFHLFRKTYTVNGEKYEITVKVGERTNSILEFAFHYFLHKKTAAQDKKLSNGLNHTRLASTSFVVVNSLLIERSYDSTIVRNEMPKVNRFQGPFAGLNRIKHGM